MSHSENNDIENDPFKKEDLDDDLFTSKEDDPFASLLSQDEPEENENTMQRLSHLEAAANGEKIDDGETTEARLAHFLDQSSEPSLTPQDSTDQQLSNILSDIDAADTSPAENTMARLGNFAEDFNRQQLQKQEEIEEDSDSYEEDDEDLLDNLTSETSETDTLISEFPASETGSEFSADLPFGSEVAAQETSPSNEWGGEADPFAPFQETPAVSEEPSAQPNPVKKKKEKPKKAKKKADKTPKIKIKKERRKKKAKIPRTGYDVLLTFVSILFLVIIGLGNYVGFITEGYDKPFFFVSFNILSFVLLLIPALLKTVKKRGIGISFFDTLIALALAFIIFGCMALVMVQARYGTQIKVSENFFVPAEISAENDFSSFLS